MNRVPSSHPNRDAGVMVTAVNVTNDQVTSNTHVPEVSEDTGIYDIRDISVNDLESTANGTVPMDQMTAAKFSRVKNNIVAALSFLRHNVKKGVDTTKDKNSISVWKELVGSVYNERIVTDGFWLVILRKNADKFKVEQSPSHRRKLYNSLGQA